MKLSVSKGFGQGVWGGRATYTSRCSGWRWRRLRLRVPKLISFHFIAVRFFFLLFGSFFCFSANHFFYSCPCVCVCFFLSLVPSHLCTWWLTIDGWMQSKTKTNKCLLQQQQPQHSIPLKRALLSEFVCALSLNTWKKFELQLQSSAGVRKMFEILFRTHFNWVEITFLNLVL